MSVVCAKVYKDKIVVCSDSILVSGWTKDNSGDFVKLKNINGMIVGACGGANEISLLWHFMRTHKPERGDEKSVLDFVVEFARWKNEYSSDSVVRNEYILVYEGKMFEISGLFVVEHPKFYAIGAGRDYSLAALHLGHSPKDATKVACELSCYVSDPIVEETMIL